MIHIVSHVYAKTHPEYAVFLRAQLSSLIRLETEDLVEITICYTDGDCEVIKVLDEFEHVFGDKLHHLRLTPGELFRRAIGRNKVALRTKEDTNLVWFCDIDHVFGDKCLTTLWDYWRARIAQPKPQPIMLWPETIQIHRDHLIGDAFWKENINARGILNINPKDFAPKSYSKAIGGVQIVSGRWCRVYGYLNGSKKWLTPTDGTRPFPDFRDDVKFRGNCEVNGTVEKIKLPNLFRLRHSSKTYK